MTIISYAQNYEDVMLWRALKHVSEGFYIDVGAAWHEIDSVTCLFYLNGWSGINIEPNRKFNELLQLHRPKDINLKIALGPSEEIVEMRFIEDTGLSTASEIIAESHEKNGWNITKERILQQTLSSVCRDNVPNDQEIHFLKVDVEGMEKGVLEGGDWLTYRPWIVLVESTIPMSKIESHHEWEHILFNADYKFVYADGLNRFYVVLEHEDLSEAFKYPPNTFDDFVTYSLVKAELRHQNAELEIQELNSRIEDADFRAMAAEARAVSCESLIKSIYRSKSWRITSPLRILKNCKLK